MLVEIIQVNLAVATGLELPNNNSIVAPNNEAYCVISCAPPNDIVPVVSNEKPEKFSPDGFIPTYNEK